jgi:acetyl esterase/lipase
MPPELAAKIAAIGRVIDPPATAALYAPLHDREPYAGVKVTRDIAYAPAERQKLDVFEAEDDASARPVLIFVHGGGFTGGNKHTPGSPFYDNIPLWAARNGLVGVNMTYPLAPEAVWPSASENAARVVRWVHDNIAAYGGDASRVFLFGHSAGATHAATYAAFPEIHGPDGPRLAGLILMSGIYDLTTFPLAPNYAAYVGDDASLYAQRSALPGLLKCPVPTMIVAAELEPPPFVVQFEKLKAALAETSTKARNLLVPQHSHISIGYSIGTDDTRLTGAILDFIRTGG